MPHVPLLRVLWIAGLAVANGGEGPQGPEITDPKVAALAKEVADKGWIAFGFLNKRGDMDLFVMRPNGTELRRMTDTPEYHEGGPRFSPDGKKIIYRRIKKFAKVHHNDWGFQGRLILADADGSNPVPLGADGKLAWASWSPDGKRIGCLTRKGVEIIDLATKKVVRKIPRKGIYQQLFWSPDGKWFCGVTNCYGEMWTVARLNAETGEINPLHKFDPRSGGDGSHGPKRRARGAECTPDWFPDGKCVLFSHKPFFGKETKTWTQLWMADGDGTRSRMVFGQERRHLYGGLISPDGKYVLFSRVWLDGAAGLLTGRRMGLIRFGDVPQIGPRSEDLRKQFPDAKEAVILDLPVGWEPDWTYTDIFAGGDTPSIPKKTAAKR